MAFDYEKTAKQLMEELGGKKNIVSLTHCMTRLRFALKNDKIPDGKKIEKIPGILRVVSSAGQYQVVIGNEVTHVYSELMKQGKFKDADSTKEETKKGGNIVARVFDFIAGSMTPLLPAMLGAGMLKTVLIVFVMSGLIDTAGSTYILLNALGDAFFYFLPLFLANTAARKLGANPMLVMIIAGAMLYPDLITLLGEGNATFLGIPVTSSTYSASVIPIFLMVPIMKYVEKWVHKIIPDILKSFMVPLLVLLISFPIAIIVIGPLGMILGSYLTIGIDWLYTHMGPIAVPLLAACLPFVVMTGMHLAVFSICIANFMNAGFDALVMPAMLLSNIGQGGATLGVALKTKNKELKPNATASSISAVFAGVTEPALYGVTLKYRRSMIGAMIGAAAGGLYAGITGVAFYVLGGAPSVFSIMQMIGPSGKATVVNGTIALVITFIVSTAASFILYKDTEEASAEKTEPDSNLSKPLIERIEIKSPLTGDIVPLEQVKDEVFSSKALGDGIAVMPKEGKVYAPGNGTVQVVTDSKHALGLVLDTGVEILIHVGLDTVRLEGTYFDAKCKMGDVVKQGDLLLEFDLKEIQKEGYDVVTPVIISNVRDYISIKQVKEGSVNKDDVILSIV